MTTTGRYETVVSRLITCIEAISSSALYQTDASDQTTLVHQDRFTGDLEKMGKAVERRFTISYAGGDDTGDMYQPSATEGDAYGDLLEINVYYLDAQRQTETTLRALDDRRKIRLQIENAANWTGASYPEGLQAVQYQGSGPLTPIAEQIQQVTHTYLFTIVEGE